MRAMLTGLICGNGTVYHPRLAIAPDGPILCYTIGGGATQYGFYPPAVLEEQVSRNDREGGSGSGRKLQPHAYEPIYERGYEGHWACEHAHFESNATASQGKDYGGPSYYSRVWKRPQAIQGRGARGTCQYGRAFRRGY